MKKRGSLSFAQKIESLVIAATIMTLGLVLFKFVPMNIFGYDILFDASMHITAAIFFLYVGWYFVDQNKSWRIPYFIFCLAVVVIVSMQRIAANAHNDIGLISGLVLSMIAIIASRWRYFKNKFDF